MESEIVKYLNHLFSGKFDYISYLISSRFFLLLMLFILFGLIYHYDKKSKNIIIFTIIFGLLLNFTITEVIIKDISANTIGIRERPYITYTDINPIGEKYTDSSFPSTHLATLLTVLTIIIYHYKNMLNLSIIAIIIMSFSRLHNGMHYLTDIFAGIILGIIYGFSSIYIIKYLLVNKKTKKPKIN